MEQFIKKVDEHEKTDDMIDTQEAKELNDTFSTMTWKDIMNFLSIPWNTEIYNKTIDKVKKSVEKNIDNNNKNSILAGVNRIRSGETDNLLNNLEKRKNLIWNKINNDPASKTINNLLTKENTSFGLIFEQSSDAIKENISSMIHTTLLENNFLSKNNVLTPTWLQVEKELTAEITKERSDNITFSLLEEIMDTYTQKIDWIKNNKEKLMEEKIALLSNIKNMMKNGGLKNIQKLSGAMATMDITWDKTSKFQKGFSLFIKEKLKENGLDMSNKKTINTSLANESIYSPTWLRLSDKKKNETILDVVPSAFKKAFSHFDTYGNSRNTMSAIVSATTEKSFDPSNIPNTYGESDINTQLPKLMAKLWTLTEWIAMDPKSIEWKQLKEMMMNKKLDTLWDKMPLKEFWWEAFVFKILDFFDKLWIKDIVMSLFGKAFNLNKEDINKLLERPFIKSGINHYKTLLWDKQDLSKKNSEINKHIPVQSNEDWKLEKMDYFRLTNNLVYIKTIDKNNPDSTKNTTWKIQKVDTNGKVIDLVDETWKPLDQSSSDPTCLEWVSGPDVDLYKKFAPSVERAGHMEDFIIKDIHKDVLISSLAVTLKNKYSTKNKNNDSLEDDKKYLIEATKIISNNNSANIDEIIKTDLQDILHENNYIYSTEDLIGNYLEKKLNTYKPVVEKAPVVNGTENSDTNQTQSENNPEDKNKKETNAAKKTTVKTSSISKKQ